jgi:hypothetical protein
LTQRNGALAAALTSHPEWKSVYADAKVVIVRRQS